MTRAHKSIHSVLAFSFSLLFLFECCLLIVLLLLLVLLLLFYSLFVLFRWHVKTNRYYMYNNQMFDQMSRARFSFRWLKEMSNLRWATLYLSNTQCSWSTGQQRASNTTSDFRQRFVVVVVVIVVVTVGSPHVCKNTCAADAGAWFKIEIERDIYSFNRRFNFINKIYPN